MSEFLLQGAVKMEIKDDSHLKLLSRNKKVKSIFLFYKKSSGRI